MGGFFGKIWNAFTYLGFYMLVGFLFPKQKDSGSKPQDLQAPPTIAQGMPIMIAAGRQRQEKSHCVDWGDVKSHPIRAKGGKKG